MSRQNTGVDKAFLSEMQKVLSTKDDKVKNIKNFFQNTHQW